MVLIDFQFIEECLKMSITTADKIIQKNVAPYFQYNYNRKDIENFALGKLVERYSKMSNNHSLVTHIRELMKERDNIAHKGFYLHMKNKKTKTY